jgi:hypothetical protein
VLDDIIHQMQAERRLTRGFRSDSHFGERGASAPWLKQEPSPEPIKYDQHRNQEPNGSRSPPTLTLDKLRRAIATRCLDRLARPWDEILQLFVTDKKQHCNLRVRKDAPAPWTALLSAAAVAVILWWPVMRSRIMAQVTVDLPK